MKVLIVVLRNFGAIFVQTRTTLKDFVVAPVVIPDSVCSYFSKYAKMIK